MFKRKELIDPNFRDRKLHFFAYIFQYISVSVEPGEYFQKW